jgi:hypothetical protein
MAKLTPFDKRTAADWAVRIEELTPKVAESEHRVADIEAGCRRLSLMVQEGSKVAQKDLERQSADLQAAVIDRDTLRDSLVAAREFSIEVAEREAVAADQAIRKRISSLADVRTKQAKEAQRHIDALTTALNAMHETGCEIHKLTHHESIRDHFIGSGFSSRLTHALAPGLKNFGILAHSDSSHPKHGLPLTEGEAGGVGALAMFDRAVKAEAKDKERREEFMADTYGVSASEEMSAA